MMRSLEGKQELAKIANSVVLTKPARLSMVELAKIMFVPTVVGHGLFGFDKVSRGKVTERR